MIRHFLSFSIFAASFCAHAAEVNFSDLFENSRGLSEIVVTVAPGDLLVIPAGNFYSNGKSIRVYASRARIDGDANIGSFEVGSKAADVLGAATTGSTPGEVGLMSGSPNHGAHGVAGGEGSVGKKGPDGERARKIVFLVRELSGAAHLALIANGQAGGAGQKGGDGGRGGKGGNGYQRVCGGLLGLDTKRGPGNGGNGGVGGKGGDGGPGGNGGDGGVIVLSQTLSKLYDSKQISVQTAGGQGGAGGAGGGGGPGGMRGSMGPGNSCGGGGQHGNDGAAGGPGSVGQMGKPGVVGEFVYGAPPI